MSDEGPAPPENLDTQERAGLVRKVVAAMPPPLREVLVLAYFHHFAYKEMADILSIPLGTVKSRLHSAVAHFGEQFRKLQNTLDGSNV
jgi:RNA polymerase sigma-70 factor (ECF subfamily)